MRVISLPPVSDSEAQCGVVFRSAAFECLYKDRGSDTLLVTFNEMGMSANGRDCWGAVPAKRLNLSIFGFVSTHPNWFPVEEILRCLEAFWKCLRNSRHKRVVVMGLSQGAYAALKFHRMLGADISIAFAPQISIDPCDVKDLRFNQFFNSHSHNDMRIRSSDVSRRCYLFFDPFELDDIKHGRMLESLDNVTAIHLPFAGHAAVQIFLGSENIWKLIEACFAHDVARIRTLFGELRHTNPDRPHLIAQAVVGRRPAIAMAIFDAYGRSGMESRWLHICWCLSEAGFGPRVIGWLREFLIAHPDHVSGRECLCLVAIRTGERDLALALAQGLYESDPESSRRRYILDLAQRLSVHQNESSVRMGTEF